MRFQLILLLFICVGLTDSLAHWSERCSEMEQGNPVQCPPSSSTLLQNKKDPAVFDKVSAQMTNMLQEEIDAEKNLFRFMRGLKNDPSSDELKELYEKRVLEFEQLARIVEQENSTSGKLQVCYQVGCSASRKIELEDQVKHLTKLKLLYFSFHPELAQNGVNELFQEKSPPYQDDDIRHALMESSSEYLKTRLEIIGQTNLYRAKALLGSDSNPFHFYPAVGEALYQTIEKLPHLDDDSLMASACLLKKEREDYYGVQKIKEIAVETTLFIAPFLFPPLNMLKLGRIGYLSTFGLRGRKLQAVTEGVLTKSVETAGFGYLLFEGHRRCDQKKIQKTLNPNSENIRDYNDCREEVEELQFQTLLIAGMNIIPLEKLSLIAPEKLKGIFNKDFPTLEKQSTSLEGATFVAKTLEKRPSATFKTQANDYLTVVDLGSAKASRVQKYKDLSGGYWNFVGETYKKRLNLSDEEIEGFLKSSRDFEERTMLIVRTKDHPTRGDPSFNGGMGIVFSKDEDALLPLEKATGIRLPRNEGEEAIEVVRLVIDDPSNTNAMKELLEQMGPLLKEKKKASSFYVYTSKIHERLYRKLGIPYEVIERPSKRDVVMKFDIRNTAE